MSTYSLDQLREDTEKKYGDFVVELGNDEEVRLRTPLRLPKEGREELRKMFRQYRELQESDDDGQFVSEQSIQLMRDQLYLLATNKNMANRMLKLVGDDLALLSGLLEAYAEATQLGEASAS